MSTNEKHLYNLEELSDYKIAGGYPDVRGWSVKDADNRVIGKVDNLMVSKKAERVVYIDVDVDQSIIDAKYDPYTNPENPEVREFINKDGENHIIIPIGLVDFNESQKLVLTDTVNHRTFAETKRYRKGDHLSRDYERHVLSSYNRPASKTEIIKDEPIDAEEPVMVTEISESRIREIVREEIVRYHEYEIKDVDNSELINDGYNSKIKTRRQYDLDGDGDVDVEVSRHHPKATNRTIDEENFYDRQEFRSRKHKWD